MSAPAVEWATGEPLWGAAGDDVAALRRPALLRYASDRFMDELETDVRSGASAVAARVATPVGYRRRPVAPPEGWTGAPEHLKLYQPAHGHFNLVAASLVCRVPGLPDRHVDAGQEEPVRGSPAGRRLLVGLVPTSSGDTFRGTGAAATPIADRDPDGNPIDPRMAELESRVLGPLDVVRAATLSPAPGMSAAAQARTVAGARASAVEASRFLLLDLAELLSTQLPDVWAAVLGGPAPVRPAAAALATLLATRAAASGDARTVRQVLATTWEQRLRIEAEAEPPPDLDIDLRGSPFDAATLRPALAAALAEVPAPAAPGGGGAPSPVTDGADPAAMPKLGGDARYVVRCVFRRPRCAPIPLDLVSEPSEPFRIAGFYDLDAPARAIRVELPIRTSIADLRKSPKNVGFMLSDQLREQLCRVSDLKSMMAGQLACGDTIDIGMLCSFSIPIITICALVVLLVFVSLLNIVFWWLPFFRLCLPILLPGKRS